MDSSLSDECLCHPQRHFLSHDSPDDSLSDLLLAVHHRYVALILVQRRRRWTKIKAT